jgi:hypothetical protein
MLLNRLSRLQRAAWVCVFLGAIPGFAWANDGVGAVAAGGIVLGKTDVIAMKKEVLEISWDRVSVDYDFVNESDGDRKEIVLFPLPAYEPDCGHSAKYYGGEPEEFSVTVDGKAVAYNTLIQATLDGKDVTAVLRKIGLSDAQIAWFTSFPEVNPFREGAREVAARVKANPADKGPSRLFTGPSTMLAPAQLAALRQAGLVEDSSDNAGGIPTWMVKITYQWLQTFPARQAVHVHHQYRPFTEVGAQISMLDPSMDAPYCIDPALRAAWKKHAVVTNGTVSAEGVSYILKSGNSWKNGIEDFTLNVIKRDPAELVSLCFPGTFQKRDAKTSSVHLTNFHPAQDLAIYFGNVNNLSDTPHNTPPKLKP